MVCTFSASTSEGFTMAWVHYICFSALSMFSAYGNDGDGDNPKSVDIVGKTIRTTQGEFPLTLENSSTAIKWKLLISWPKKQHDYKTYCTKEGSGVKTQLRMNCFKSETTASLPEPVYLVEVYTISVARTKKLLLSSNVKTCLDFMDYIMVMQPTCETGTVYRICYKLQSKWMLYTIDQDDRISLEEEEGRVCGSDTGERVKGEYYNHETGDIISDNSHGSDDDFVIKVRTRLGEPTLAKEETIDTKNWELQMSWDNKIETTFQRYTPTGELGTLYHLSYRMECYKSRNTGLSSSLPVYKVKLISLITLLVADVTTCSYTPENIQVLAPVGTTIRINRICLKVQSKWILYTIDEYKRINLTEDTCDEKEHLLWEEVGTRIQSP